MPVIRRHFLYLFAAFLILSGCEKEFGEIDRSTLVFPIGRSFLNANSVNVSVNGDDHNFEPVPDSCGGYWMVFQKSELQKGDSVKFTFTIRKGDLKLLHESDEMINEWLSPSFYIDSDHPEIIAKAEEQTKGLTTKLEKAQKLQNYVATGIMYQIYRDASLDKASLTLNLHYGTCMNASRLYVALCRAVGVPARTVWGIIDGDLNDGNYDSHHQWAESMDDDGYWHPTDFWYVNAFDLNDVRYLDLIYAAEENTLLKSTKAKQLMFEKLVMNNDYPTAYEGKLGFKQLKDYRPDSMVVSYTYVF